MKLRLLALSFVLALAPGLASAQSAFSTIGPHIGFSSGPSQIVFGGQLGIMDVAPQVDFVPGVDIGFGDDQTVISLNGDFHYRFDVTGTQWQPYAGAGLAVHFVSWDAPGPLQDNSDTVAGGSLIVGADVPTQRGSRFFVEGKFGLGDGPDLKVLAGWSFKMR